MKRTWLKIGAYVQLKNDVASDGKIVSCHGKGNWTVAWDHNGTQSKHRSKELKQNSFAEPSSESQVDKDGRESVEVDGETVAPFPYIKEIHKQCTKNIVMKSVIIIKVLM